MKILEVGVEVHRDQKVCHPVLKVGISTLLVDQHLSHNICFQLILQVVEVVDMNRILYCPVWKYYILSLDHDPH